MSVLLEQIDLLRERANVSYQDAKEALENSDNNVVDALVYLEKEKKFKTRSASSESSFMGKVKHIIKKGNETKFIIKKEEYNIINIPVTAAIIIGIVATPVAIVGIPVALFTNHKIKLENKNGEDSDLNRIFDTVSEKVHSMADILSKDYQKNKE